MNKKTIINIPELNNLNRAFLVGLSFFFQNKSREQIDYIQHKIDEIIRYDELYLILKKVKNTQLGFTAAKLRKLLLFKYFKGKFYKKIWYRDVFYLLNNLARELNYSTKILEPYFIDYQVTSSDYLKRNQHLIKKACELYKKEFKTDILSKTAIRKKAFDKHPLSNYDVLLDKITHRAFKCVLAFHKDKIVGFGFSETLELEYDWVNICELRGLVVDPDYQGFGIEENITLVGQKYIIESLETNRNIDYTLAMTPTFHPITVQLLEKLNYRPIGIIIGAVEDYFGYTEPGYGNSDFINYIVFINDFKDEIKNSSDIVFVNKEDYWFIKLMYMFLRCRRHLVIIKSDMFRKIDYEKIKVIREEIDIIKSEGKGIYFVDLSKKDAPAISRFLSKSGFYLCGILPTARTIKGTRHDYAYYRYLDENKTPYPYIFTNYLGIGTRYKFTMGYLKHKAVENFNRTRLKNKIPKVGIFFNLNKLHKKKPK